MKQMRSAYQKQPVKNVVSCINNTALLQCFTFSYTIQSTVTENETKYRYIDENAGFTIPSTRI